MRIANKIIMTLAGLLLIAAAVLKFHEMLSICVPSWRTNPTGFWESYEFLLIQIPLEFALGVWMVSGLFRKAAWLAGTLAYFGFIFVTIFKVVTGAESCGCFGQVHFDPRITLFVIDIPFFLLLAVFRPKGCKLLPPPWPNTFYLLAVAVPVMAVLVLSAPALVTFRPNCIKPQEISNTESQLHLELYKLKQELAKKEQKGEQLKQQIESLKQQIQTLQQAKTTPAVPEPNHTESQVSQAQTPETKITTPTENQNTQSPTVKQWDWLQYVVEDDVRTQLSEGMVVVLMYHHDCPTCAEMVPKYSDYCKQMTEEGNAAFTIAFLAIPPYAETGPVPANTTCILGKLTDRQKWEVTSPYVVAAAQRRTGKNLATGYRPRTGQNPR